MKEFFRSEAFLILCLCFGIGGCSMMRAKATKYEAEAKLIEAHAKQLQVQAADKPAEKGN